MTPVDGSAASLERDGSGDNALPSPVLGLVGLHRTADRSVATDGIMGLNRNERVQPLPDWFLDKLRSAVDSDLLTSYPLTGQLYRELSTHLGVDEKRLLLTPGSDGAVKAVYQAYLRPGDGVMMLDPSYAMYDVYAHMFQAQPVPVPFDRNLQLVTTDLVDNLVDGVRLVMIANPNQPTGTILEEKVLLQVIHRAEAIGALVAIDEAYYPFSQVSVLPWVEQFPHLLVIRTFSKAAGLAGLRIGYIVGNEQVVVNLSKVRSAHDVNTMAILCARLILACPEVVDDCVAEVQAGREVLSRRVSQLGLDPLPTYGNFMLIRVAHRHQPEELVAGLRDHGYLVKGPFEPPCLADCVRVTLGPPALMDNFADALARVLIEFEEGSG